MTIGKSENKIDKILYKMCLTQIYMLLRTKFANSKIIVRPREYPQDPIKTLSHQTGRNPFNFAHTLKKLHSSSERKNQFMQNREIKK